MYKVKLRGSDGNIHSWGFAELSIEKTGGKHILFGGWPSHTTRFPLVFGTLEECLKVKTEIENGNDLAVIERGTNED